MPTPKILALSSTMGLGHMTRDLIIMQTLRKQLPAAQITWLTAPPNTTLIKETDEQIHPYSAEMRSQSEAAEQLKQTGHQYHSKHGQAVIQRLQKHNAKVLAKTLSEEQPDLVFGDEAVEILWVLARHPELKRWPLIILTDALYPIAAEPVRGANLLKRWLAYRERRKYVRFFGSFKASGYEPYLFLYVGVEAEIPNERMGIGLPRLRAFFTEHFQPVGYIVQPDIASLRLEGRVNLKLRLGYAPEKRLIVASVGGSALGLEVLQSVNRAAVTLEEVAGQDLEIILFCGPRINPESIHPTSNSVKVTGFNARIHEHYAAADFAIITAGLSSAIEIAALGVPFAYVPIPGLVEQEAEVAPRLRSLGLGRQMRMEEMTNKELADSFKKALSAPPPREMSILHTRGAEVVAGHIVRMLGAKPIEELAPPATERINSRL